MCPRPLYPATDGATKSSGSGTATVDWTSATETFTYTLPWTGLTGPATMAHIHYGAPGVSGPIVIPFFMTTMLASDTIGGTRTAADFEADPAAGINTIADVATAIQDGDAYVNIHTAEYPAGELRGQFGVSNAAPEPSTAGLIMFALVADFIALVGRRRLI